MLQQLKKYAAELFSAAGTVLALTGCATNWDSLPIDRQEAPAELVRDGQKAFEARKKDRKTAYFVARDPTYTYVHAWFGPVTQAQVNDQFTRQLGQSLVKNLSEMQDLSVLGVHAEKSAPRADVTIYFQVTGVHIQETEKTAVTKGLTAGIGASLNDRQVEPIVFANGRGVQMYFATVTANVHMVDVKTKKTLCSYDVGANTIPSPVCFPKDLTECMDELAKQAKYEYRFRYGPPVFVTETRNNGEMVRINIGKDCGVTPGMKFIFYSKSAQGQEQQIATGTVRTDAPEDIGEHETRIVIHGHASKKQNPVLKNMLAKPVR